MEDEMRVRRAAEALRAAVENPSGRSFEQMARAALAAADQVPCVVIRPRAGVDAERVRGWLERNFQWNGAIDWDTEDSGSYITHNIINGNPLVNAEITVEEVER